MIEVSVQTPPSFDERLPEEPEDIARAFFADYQQWNDFAYACSKAGNDYQPANRSYDALIAKYCREGKQRQGLAFGSRASHSPETSKVVGVKGKGDRRKVTEINTNEHGFEATYEYDLRFENGRWVLDELYFVDMYDRNRRLRCL